LFSFAALLDPNPLSGQGLEFTQSAEVIRAELAAFQIIQADNTLSKIAFLSSDVLPLFQHGKTRLILIFLTDRTSTSSELLLSANAFVAQIKNQSEVWSIAFGSDNISGFSQALVKDSGHAIISSQSSATSIVESLLCTAGKNCLQLINQR
jgi:hypothetical protein